MDKRGITQLQCDLGTLTFARVSSIRQRRGDVTVDLLKKRPDSSKPLAHFFGFATALVGNKSSIWFQLETNTGYGANKGMFLGPVNYRPSINNVSDLPYQDSIIVGSVVESSKGPLFEWWCHDAEPFLAFSRMVTSARMRSSAKTCRELTLQSSSCTRPDDLWCLACLVLMGDFLYIASGMDGHEGRKHPFRTNNGYSRARGIDILHEPVEYIFHTSVLLNSTAIYKRFLSYLGTHQVNVNVGPWTIENLKSLISTGPQLPTAVGRPTRARGRQ